MTVIKKLRIVSAWARINRKVEEAERACLDLMENPDATSEQVEQARQILRRIRAITAYEKELR